jgi:hypothetical protein
MCAAVARGASHHWHSAECSNLSLVPSPSPATCSKAEADALCSAAELVTGDARRLRCALAITLAEDGGATETAQRDGGDALGSTTARDRRARARQDAGALAARPLHHRGAVLAEL